MQECAIWSVFAIAFYDANARTTLALQRFLADLICACGAPIAADLFFHPDEIHGAYLLLSKPSPDEPPRLNEVLRLVAQLGGFLGRKSDGEPGVKTIRLGMQRVADVATACGRYVKERVELCNEVG